MTTQVVRSIAGEEFGSAVGMLKLLADETRLRVICALLEGEHPVNELGRSSVGAQPAAVLRSIWPSSASPAWSGAGGRGRASSTSSTMPMSAASSRKCSPTRTT